MKLVWFTDDRDPAAVAAAKYLMGKNWRVALNERGGTGVDGCERTSVDLCDAASLKAAMASFGDALRGVVHPAPPAIRASIEGADDSLWRRAFEEGALSAILTVAAAGEHMAAYERGAIIALSSIHAEKPMGHGFLYSMGCAATQMLMRDAALDYGAKGINCFFVQRGIMEHDVQNAGDIGNLYSGAAFRYPKKRMPEPESLSGLIEFLLSGAAAALNGADLRADEGMVMYYGNQLEGVSPT